MIEIIIIFTLIATPTAHKFGIARNVYTELTTSSVTIYIHNTYILVYKYATAHIFIEYYHHCCCCN